VSEFLSDEEQISRFKTWWDENGIQLLVCVGLAVAATVGWRLYDDANQKAMQLGSKAFAQYKQAEIQEREAIADRIKREFAGSSYHALVSMQQASEANREGDLQKTAALLEDAIAAAGRTVLADLARLRLAKVQFGLERTETALSTLRDISNEGYRSWALESQGDMYFALGDVEQAHTAYSAAYESMKEGDQRPLLQIKVENTAPTDGEFVAYTSDLDQALEAAESSLVQEAKPEKSENE
jgi:predicted negative regulator of RcsB-dependent stress response